MGDHADDTFSDMIDDQELYDKIYSDGFEDSHDIDDHDFFEQFDGVHCSTEGPMYGFMPMSAPYDREGMEWELHACDMYFRGLMSGYGKSIKDLFVFQNKKTEPRWQSADGKVYRVPDMTTSHILNALRHMDKQGKSDEPIYKLMEKEIEKRWDI